MIDIKVKSITVKKSRIICMVEISKQKFSNEKIKDALLKIRPSLKSHKCKNNQSRNFAYVMDKTSVAHLLEHLIIDYQIESATKAGLKNTTILGTSEWINKEDGIAKIEFSFFDDLVALNCLKNSVDLLNRI